MGACSRHADADPGCRTGDERNWLPVIHAPIVPY
jgi:hypothetical protein